MKLRLAGTALAAVLALSACGDDAGKDDASDTPTSDAPTTSAPADGPSSTPTPTPTGEPSASPTGKPSATPAPTPTQGGAHADLSKLPLDAGLHENVTPIAEQGKYALCGINYWAPAPAASHRAVGSGNQASEQGAIQREALAYATEAQAKAVLTSALAEACPSAEAEDGSTWHGFETRVDGQYDGVRVLQWSDRGIVTTEVARFGKVVIISHQLNAGGKTERDAQGFSERDLTSAQPLFDAALDLI